MKKALFALIACSAIFGLASAQTTAAEQSDAQKATASSPELQEAARLSEEAVRLFNEKRFDEALAPAKRAVEIREKALGTEHDLVLIATLDLAGIYVEKAKYGEAESLYNVALQADKTSGATGQSNRDRHFQF